MPPLEAWEKVFLDDADFMESTHGQVGCVICHGGDSSQKDKELAHQTLVADPSDITCYTCHSDVTHVNELSLHTSLGGFKSVLEARGGNLEEGSKLLEAFENHCQQCHTTCGQCHVSRPDELGGGLVSDHEFRETPSMQYNCIACHGDDLTGVGTVPWHVINSPARARLPREVCIKRKSLRLLANLTPCP